MVSTGKRAGGRRSRPGRKMGLRSWQGEGAKTVRYSFGLTYAGDGDASAGEYVRACTDAIASLSCAWTYRRLCRPAAMYGAVSCEVISERCPRRELPSRKL